MTAQRWWVKMFARWQARIDASLPEIKLGLQMISSGGIGSASLAYLGQKWLVVPFIIAMVVGILAYAYIAFEKGVKNQVARDRADMTSNFAGPNMWMQALLTAMAVVAGVFGKELTEERRDAIQTELDRAFEELREGIPEDKLR